MGQTTPQHLSDSLRAVDKPRRRHKHCFIVRCREEIRLIENGIRGGVKIKDIAKVLDVTVPTVRNRLKMIKAGEILID